MTLESLALRNFQCHGDVRLKLDPHVTVIVGPSDAGKSALLRALRWVCQNVPSGADFITHGEESCAVTLGVDSHTVTRSRGKGVNSYTLDKGQFHAFGQSSVPDEIARLLNVGDANFQAQLDDAFWFHLTPGQVARELNQIVNLDVIDRVLDKTAVRVKKSRAALEVCTERMEEALRTRDFLSWVEECHARHEALLVKERTLAENRARIACIASAVEEARNYEERRRRALEAEESRLKLVSLCEEGSTLRRRIESLQNLLRTLRAECEKRDRLQNSITATEAELAAVKDLLCPACGQPVRGSRRSSSATST